MIAVEVIVPPQLGHLETFSPPLGVFIEVIVGKGEQGAAGIQGPQGPPGPPGPPGPGGIADLVLGEVPVGAVDGSNTDYTTAADFDFLWVYLGGLRQSVGVDYTITGSNSFSFLSPPWAGAVLVVDYA